MVFVKKWSFLSCFFFSEVSQKSLLVNILYRKKYAFRLEKIYFGKSKKVEKDEIIHYLTKAMDLLEK